MVAGAYAGNAGYAAGDVLLAFTAGSTVIIGCDSVPSWKQNVQLRGSSPRSTSNRLAALNEKAEPRVKAVAVLSFL